MDVLKYLTRRLDEILSLSQANGLQFSEMGPEGEEKSQIIRGQVSPSQVPFTQALSVKKRLLGKIDFYYDKIPNEPLRPIRGVIQQLSVVLAQSARQTAIHLDLLVAELHQANPHFGWSGVYQLRGDELYLVSFRGEFTPHSVIPKDKGICGLAVRENATINIKDVHTDSRYLSCDIRTQSELVVPIRDEQGNAIGEIDIDSHQINAFSQKDEQQLEILAKNWSPYLNKLKETHDAIS